MGRKSVVFTAAKRRRASAAAGVGGRRSSVTGGAGRGGGKAAAAATTTTVAAAAAAAAAAAPAAEPGTMTTLGAIVGALGPRKAPKPKGSKRLLSGAAETGTAEKAPPAAAHRPPLAAAAGAGARKRSKGLVGAGDGARLFPPLELGCFDSLPGDVAARILFSGYFDTAFVLGRLSLVSKRLRDLAAQSYLRLDLSRLRLGPADVQRLAQRFQGVTHADFSFCPNITDAAVEALLPWRHSLRALSLRGCPVTDMGVQFLGACAALERLDLSKKSMDQTLMITDLGVSSLRGLTRLRAVSLAWNKCLTDDGLAALLLPNTTARRGRGGVREGEQRAPAKRGVRELDLSCCVGLTDRACELLATQPLERLSLLGCPMLTDAGLRLLTLGPPSPHHPTDPTQTPPPPGACGPLPPPPTTRATLRALNLAHCGALTDAAVEGLVGLPGLMELDMRDCTLLSAEARSRLQKRLPGADVGCS